MLVFNCHRVCMGPASFCDDMLLSKLFNVRASSRMGHWYPYSRTLVIVHGLLSSTHVVPSRHWYFFSTTLSIILQDDSTLTVWSCLLVPGIIVSTNAVDIVPSAIHCCTSWSGYFSSPTQRVTSTPSYRPLVWILIVGLRDLPEHQLAPNCWSVYFHTSSLDCRFWFRRVSLHPPDWRIAWQYGPQIWHPLHSQSFLC